jgi:ribosomal protein L37AE/L43A
MKKEQNLQEHQKHTLNKSVVSNCCPKCGHHYIYDIGYDNWECGDDDCKHSFRNKSKTRLKSTKGNNVNTLSYTGRCIIKNKITNEIYLLETTDEGLKVATKENLKNDEHHSFYLYSADKNGKCKLVAELVRDFGKSDLYWKPCV